MELPAMPSQTIPVVDLQDFTVGSAAAQAAFVTQVGQALEDIGFFAVVNHGVKPELIQQAYAAATEFFELPEVVKQQYAKPEWHGQRGFTQFGQEHAKDQMAPDLKEFWHVGRQDSPDYPPNLWPSEVPQFQPVFTQLYQQLETCGLQLLEACALYLGEPRSCLRSWAEGSDTILRIIHYPPIPADAHPASLRSAPHEDINLITLLCEATAAGLELQQRDGQWLPIAALPGQIIVDSGDMLQQLTNGLLRSTTHRVTNPLRASDRRFSMPFFVHPRSGMDLTPLPKSVARTGGVQRFPRITAGAYLQQRLREIGLF